MLEMLTKGAGPGLVHSPAGPGPTIWVQVHLCLDRLTIHSPGYVICPVTAKSWRQIILACKLLPWARKGRKIYYKIGFVNAVLCNGPLKQVLLTLGSTGSCAGAIAGKRRFWYPGSCVRASSFVLLSGSFSFITVSARQLFHVCRRCEWPQMRYFSCNLALG